MDSKRRCACCNKKLGLTVYPCRCGGLYCTTHKPDVEHNCQYDYRKEFIQGLSTTMEKIVAKKVDVL
jgi:hypothetical protein